MATLSYDEKPGIQAIATTAPDLPPKPRKHSAVQRDHEYKRLGTVTLSAVDLVTGIVHHAVTERHCGREFVSCRSSTQPNCGYADLHPARQSLRPSLA